MVIFGAMISPVGLIAAGVAALAYGLVELYDKVQKVHDVFNGIYDFFTGKMPTAAGTVHGLFNGLSANMGTTRNTVLELHAAWHESMDKIRQVMTPLVGFAKQVWDQISGSINQHMGEIKQTISVVMSTIASVWKQIWPDLSVIVKATWDIIKTVIMTGVKVIEDIIYAALALLRGNWSQAFHYLWDAVKTVFEGIVSVIKTTLTQVIPAAIALVLKLGKDIVEYLLHGLENLGSGLLHKIESLMTEAFNAVISWVAGEAGRVGRAIVDGIIGGAEGLAKGLGDKLKHGAESALHAATSFLGINSPSRKARDEIGIPIAEGIILGTKKLDELPFAITSKLRAALDAAKNVVTQFQSTLDNAFQQLASRAMAAFDAATQAHLSKMAKNFANKIKNAVTDPLNAALASAQDVYDAQMNTLDQNYKAQIASITAAGAKATPAEAALAALQEQHNQQQLKQALTDAQAQLKADQASGADPSTMISDQRSLADALYNIKVDQLQKLATTQRAAQDAQTAAAQTAADAAYNANKAFLDNGLKITQDTLNKQYAALETKLTDQYNIQVTYYQNSRTIQSENLQGMLTELQTQLEKHPEEWKAIHAKIMKLFHVSFGPDYRTVGKNMGKAFADGIRDSFNDVQAAVTELAKLVAKYLKLNSPAEAGPLSSLDTWWKPMASVLVGGIDKGVLGQGLADAVTSPSAFTGYGTSAAAGSASTTSDGKHFHVSFPGAVFLSGDQKAAREAAETIAPHLERILSL
jgi:hypothetical protein